MASRYFAALLLSVGTLAGCAAAPTRPAAVNRGDHEAVRRHLEAVVRHQMRKHDVTGLSIALVDDQRVLWAQGFGWADRENKVAATPQTIYRVGSISKLFTATAAMQLAERGRLDIDQPLKKVLPEFSIGSRYAGTEAITPRQLMSHHAGLPRDVLKGMWSTQPVPFTQTVHDLRESDAAYPPDTVFAYSNTGVALLGHAIQNVSGQEFHVHMERSLLRPLGMADSAFLPGVSPSPLMAKAYLRGKLTDEPPLGNTPAGGLNSSVLDLGRFLSMVFAQGRVGEQQIVKRETLAEMLRPQNRGVALDVGFGTGLGWMLSTLGTDAIRNAGPVIHHNGATVMFRSQMFALPEHKLGVVVLSNASTAGEAVNRIAGEALSFALEAKSGIRQPALQKLPRAETPWAPDAMQAYMGDYTTALGHMRIRTKGQGLRIDALGQRAALVPRSDGRLALEYRLLGLIPISLGDLDHVGISQRRIAGRDVLVARIGEQDMLLGEKIVAPASLGPWLQRSGEYEIGNLGNDHPFVGKVLVKHERGLLLVEATMNDEPGQVLRWPLMPLSDTQALLLGPLRDAGEVLRWSDGADGEQVEFAGYTLRRIDP